MVPELFSIGPFALHTYGIFLLIGLAAGLLVSLRIGREDGADSRQILSMALVLMFAALIGSRAAFVLIHFDFYRDRPLESFKFWEGGFVFSGGLIAALLAPALKRPPLSYWALGDIFAPGVAVGQAIGRIGCFMAGCCYGKPTAAKWGVVFTRSDALAPLHIPLHPTQLYSAVLGLATFAILLALRSGEGFKGRILLWFLILHSTGRLFVERFRGDDRGILPGADMSWTQFAALVILLASASALFVLKSRLEKSRS